MVCWRRQWHESAGKEGVCIESRGGWVGKTRPEHFDKAIRILNWQILLALKFSLEILLGLVVNTSKMPLEVSCSFLPPADVDAHMTYMAQQQLDGYAKADTTLCSRRLCSITESQCQRQELSNSKKAN